MSNLPVVKNSLESYLLQINQFPLLTQEEEFQLAVRYRKYNDIEAVTKINYIKFKICCQGGF